MRGYDVVVEAAQVLVEEILEEVEVLVEQQYGFIGLVLHLPVEPVHDLLFVGAEFVEEKENGYALLLVLVSYVESLALVCFEHSFFPQQAVCSLDGLL